MTFASVARPGYNVQYIEHTMEQYSKGEVTPP